MKAKLEQLVKDWHEEGRAEFEAQYKNLDYDSESYLKTVIEKVKYYYLNDGNSGAFIIEKLTGDVFCIKGYGVPNKKKYCGNVNGITGEVLNRLRRW